MEGQSKFEGWAIVELMGHQTEIGYVTTETYGAAAMFRIDTPEREAEKTVLERPQYVDRDPEGKLSESETYRGAPAGSTVEVPREPGKSRLVSPAAIYAINPCTEEAARVAIEQRFRRPLTLLALPERPALPEPEYADVDEMPSF